MTDPERRCVELLGALDRAAVTLRRLSRYRKEAHEYDRDMGMTPRTFFDGEDWDIVEQMALEGFQAARAVLRGQKAKRGVR